MKNLLNLLPAAIFLLSAGVAIQLGYGWIGGAAAICAFVAFFEGLDGPPSFGP